MVARVRDRATGLGALEPLLADPRVTEVMVNGPGPVWVERHGRLERSGVEVDARAVAHLVARVLAPVGARADRASPLADARLPDGSRVHVVVPPLAVDGPCVTIRRFGATAVPLDVLRRPRRPGPAHPGRARAPPDRGERRGRGRQDHPAQRPRRGDPPAGEGGHGGGRGRAPPARRPRGPPRGPPGQRRGPGRGHHPRPGAGRPPHAPRPHRGGRGPWTGGPRHAPGHDDGPRRLAQHLPRQRPRRCPASPGDHGPDGGRPPAAGDPRTGGQRHRPGRLRHPAGRRVPGRGRGGRGQPRPRGPGPHPGRRHRRRPWWASSCAHPVGPSPAHPSRSRRRR